MRRRAETPTGAPFWAETPIDFLFGGEKKKSFVVSLNFVASVTSISKDPSLGGNFAPGHKREPAAKPEVALRRVRVKPH